VRRFRQRDHKIRSARAERPRFLRAGAGSRIAADGDPPGIAVTVDRAQLPPSATSPRVVPGLTPLSVRFRSMFDCGQKKGLRC